MELKRVVKENLEATVADRRHLHQYPELSGEESGTAAYIADRLREMGLEPQMAKSCHGVIALIRGGKGPGKCVGLRADMDALPIQETTGLPYASRNGGKMHACGHDMHMAGLLGTARVLNAMRDRFAGTVKLIFQPSEENAASSGARKLVEAGVLESPHVDAVFGQHVWPLLEVGQVGVRDGAMMASSDRFAIHVRGRASHGSAPENGVDAIAAAGQVITAVQNIVARQLGPQDSAVVTIGTIHGGDRYNVIAGDVDMEGTVRTLDPAVRASMEGRLRRAVEGACMVMGAQGSLDYIRGNDTTVNSPELFPLALACMQEAVGEGNAVVPKKSALASEDFNYYGKKVPSLFFWTGVHTPGTPVYALHNSNLAPNENALPIIMEVMSRCAMEFLNR